MDEIRRDSCRREQFVQLCAALETFTDDSASINLPDSCTLFEMFGKVS